MTTKWLLLTMLALPAVGAPVEAQRPGQVPGRASTSTETDLGSLDSWSLVGLAVASPWSDGEVAFGLEDGYGVALAAAASFSSRNSASVRLEYLSSGEGLSSRSGRSERAREVSAIAGVTWDFERGRNRLSLGPGVGLTFLRRVFYEESNMGWVAAGLAELRRDLGSELTLLLVADARWTTYSTPVLEQPAPSDPEGSARGRRLTFGVGVAWRPGGAG